jgi:acetolactate decarboxylase
MMNRSIKSKTARSIVLFLSFILLSLSAQANTLTVQWKGALKRVHHGDSSATLHLSQFEKTPHLYAIGPVAGLDGEITVLDSQFYVAQVRDGKIQLKQDPSISASFLVWAEVPAWQTPVKIQHKIQGEKQLTVWIENKAKEQGLNLDEPFPFLIQADFESAQFHVLAAAPQAKMPTHKHHQAHGMPSGHLKQAKKVRLQNESAQVLGFYSRHHGGVFTHMGSQIHLHLYNQKGHSGHLDDFVLNAKSQLIFPVLE